MSDREGVGIDQVRQFALALPGTTEEPHFDLTSFRVRGKIFATMPSDEQHLNVFVAELEVPAWVAQDPDAVEPLLWGRTIRGLRVSLSRARASLTQELIEEAWRRKAPARVIAEHDEGRTKPR